MAHAGSGMTAVMTEGRSVPLGEFLCEFLVTQGTFERMAVDSTPHLQPDANAVHVNKGMASSRRVRRLFG
jgi:hypothetical protein